MRHKPSFLHLDPQRLQLGNQAHSGLVRVGELGEVVGRVVVPLHKGGAVSRDDGPVFIEGNAFPGQDLSQYPRLNLGTYGVMQTAIKE